MSTPSFNYRMSAAASDAAFLREKESNAGHIPPSPQMAYLRSYTFTRESPWERIFRRVASKLKKMAREKKKTDAKNREGMEKKKATKNHRVCPEPYCLPPSPYCRDLYELALADSGLVVLTPTPGRKRKAAVCRLAKLNPFAGKKHAGDGVEKTVDENMEVSMEKVKCTGHAAEAAEARTLEFIWLV